jgi:crotonobetainyl-CoA:carnitine CoA-transferase CaiB-like acyl-CoA transferase
MRNPGMGPIFLNTNRSKRCVCIDLKKEEGRAALLKLVETADVLVYNVRPAAMARLNLGYDVMAKINPRLIYAGVFGFSQAGPYAAKPAYDDLIQGATALPALNARISSDGVPRYVPNALVDRIVGLMRWAPFSPASCIATRPARASASISRCSRPWRAS